MVDLLSSVPTSGPTTKPVQSSLSPGEIAGPYSLLARGLEKTGEAADTVASSLADQAGLRAVTTDADGNVKVDHAPIIGPAAIHYHNAVKFAALAEGEGAARRKDIELRKQFRDNPDGYNAAATQFMDSLQDQYTKAAGPLVGLSLRKAVELTTTQTYKGLLNEKERLELYRSNASMASGIEDAQNQMGALVNQGVTSGPEWDALDDKYKTLINQRVNNPRLAYPREQANLDMEKFHSELQGRATEYRALQVLRDKENGGYDKAIEFAKSIKTDRSLNLSLVRRDELTARAISQVNAAQRDDDRKVQGIAADINSLNDNLSLKGIPPAPDRIAQVKAAVDQNGDPRLRKMMGEAEFIANWAKDAGKFTPAELEQSRSNLLADMREHGSSDMGETLLKAHDGLLKSARKGITEDQLNWADQTGLMKAPPIQFSSPDAAGQMVDRAARAKIIAREYGTPVQYFRKDEKIALEAAVSAGGPEMKKVAKLMVDGFGADAPAAMKELSKSAPVLAHIGALQISGGDEGFTDDVTTGLQMRANRDFMKEVPENMRNVSDISFGAQSAQRQAVYGGAFALLPDHAQASKEAADNAFFARAYRNHYDMSLGKGKVVPGAAGAEPSRKAYEDALQQSAGAHFIGDQQYGGVATYTHRGGYASYKSGGPFWGYDAGKVVVPSSVKADRFGDVIRSLTDEDLRTMAISPQKGDGTPYPVRDIHNAMPVKTQNGYAFAQGDPQSADPKWIRNQLGAQFVLDYEQIEPKLRRRVPDAFMSGR